MYDKKYEMENLQEFKNLLQVPSKSYYEDQMVEHIKSVLDTIDGVEYFVDDLKNIYVTKGGSEYKPMFVAHTDTVHQLVDEIVVTEFQTSKPYTYGRYFDSTEFKALKALTPDGKPTGIGGDDKCGIFICLELLKKLDNVKVGLFMAEEVGCIGSSGCDLNFLKDVGYIVQFDAPGNHLITEICSGVRMFERDSEFFTKAFPVIENGMGTQMELQSHPYTDVSVLKKKSDVACINISCGYYNMHTSNEFIVIDDVERAIKVGVELYNTLGTNKYEYIYGTTYNKNKSWVDNLTDEELDEVFNGFQNAEVFTVDTDEKESSLVIMEEEDGAYIYNDENNEGFFLTKKDMELLAWYLLDEEKMKVF